ncbi:MAG: ArsA family ATPase [Candidatus Micrarchaeia archaeon]|jgi:arsenite-transporting ATPase
MNLQFLFGSKKTMILVCGKGGVGKTTFSSILSVYSMLSARTLAVSIDPAHHLGDVLGMRLSHTASRVNTNLYAMEPDLERLIREYLHDSIESMKYAYKEITALNLDRYLDTLKESPGIEEDSLLNYLWKLRGLDFERIIVDTPPTSITTRILKLPWIQSIWVDRLIDLRGKIIGYRETIESIRAGKKVEVDDPILKELLNIRREVEEGKSFFQNRESMKIVGVTVAERLPFLELKRFRDSLNERDISLDAIVVNRYVEDERHREFMKELESEFQGIVKIIVPLSPEEIAGIEKIKNFINNIRVL